MNAERQQPTPTPLSLEAMTSTTSLETSQFTTNQPKTAAIPRTLETKISVTKALVEMSRAHYPNTTTLGDSAENKVEVVASTTTVVGEMAAAYTTEQSGRQMISSGLHATLVAGVCGGVLLFALMVTVLIPVAILVAWKRKRKSRTQTLRVNESSVNLISTSTGMQAQFYYSNYRSHSFYNFIHCLGNTARVLQRMNGTGNGQPEVTVNNQLQVQEQQKYQHLANQHGTVRSQPPNV